MEEKHTRRRSNIDSGWAWVVLVASLLGSMVLTTALYMNGVVYVELLDRFKEGEAKTSLVGALCSGLLCCAAPVVGALNNKISCRFSIVLGGVISTIGFAACAFVSNLNMIILFNGIFVGVGFALSMSGIVCAVGFYFEKHRDFVLSVIFSSVGLAMFFSAPFGLFLLTECGIKATYLILASILAQLCVIGMISRPSVIERDVQRQKFMESKTSVSNSKSYIDVTLLKNKSYLFFLFSISSWNFCLSAGSIHLPNYVVVLSGSNSDISLIMLLFALSNFAGRLSGSFVVSRMSKHCAIIYICELGITSILTALFPLYSNLTGGLHFFTVQLGLFTGLPNTLMMAISLEYVGVFKLSEAYGYFYLFCGFGFFTGPVFIGYLFGACGSYEYSFMALGGVLLLGSLSAAGSLCCRSNNSNDDLRITKVNSIRDLDNSKFDEVAHTAVNTVRSGSYTDLIYSSGTSVIQKGSNCKEDSSLLHIQS